MLRELPGIVGYALGWMKLKKNSGCDADEDMGAHRLRRADERRNGVQWALWSIDGEATFSVSEQSRTC